MTETKSLLCLENKVVLVTGAAVGMGAVSAKEFARLGAKVLMSDIQDEAGEKTAAEIRDALRTALQRQVGGAASGEPGRREERPSKDRPQ